MDAVTARLPTLLAVLLAALPAAAQERRDGPPPLEAGRHYQAREVLEFQYAPPRNVVRPRQPILGVEARSIFQNYLGSLGAEPLTPAGGMDGTDGVAR